MCRGYSNSTLLAALGVFALITFLLQVQCGAINPLEWFRRPPADAAAKDGAKPATGAAAKQPPMLAYPEDPLRAAADAYAVQRRREIDRADSISRQVWRSVRQMDGAAAARMLGAMEQTAALKLLQQLKARDLARIFEAAPPAQAALWAAALLDQPELPPVPEPFKARAKAAGLYDDTQELLEKYAAGAGNPAKAEEAADSTAPPETAAGQEPAPAAGAAATPGAEPGAPAVPDGTDAPPGTPGAGVIPGNYRAPMAGAAPSRPTAWLPRRRYRPPPLFFDA